MSGEKIYRSKIRYASGLISLILLPIICVWYLHKHNAFEKDRAIEIIWSDNDTDTNLAKTQKERHFANVVITGDDKQDQSKLDSLQIAVRNMQSRADTVNGIHIYFGNNSTYQSMVRAINICLIELTYYFQISDNNMWIIYSQPLEYVPDENDRVRCGNPEIEYRESLLNFLEEKEREKEQVRQLNKPRLVKLFSLSMLLFLAMVILTATTIKKEWVRKSLSQHCRSSEA